MTSHLASTGPEARSLVPTPGQGCAFLPRPTARDAHSSPRRSPPPASFVPIVPLLETAQWLRFKNRWRSGLGARHWRCPLRVSMFSCFFPPAGPIARPPNAASFSCLVEPPLFILSPSCGAAALKADCSAEFAESLTIQIPGFAKLTWNERNEEERKDGGKEGCGEGREESEEGGRERRKKV